MDDNLHKAKLKNKKIDGQTTIENYRVAALKHYKIFSGNDHRVASIPRR